MTRCKNQPAKLKDIIGSFTPFLIAVFAQYILNFIDVAILFFKNMRSDEKSNSENTIGKILQMDYNQPMNQAYLVLAQHIVFLICFGVWYYRIFYRGNIVSTDESFEDNTKGRMKNIFSCVCSIRTPFLLLAGVAIQIMVDGILNLVSPLFPDTFAAYYELVSKTVGAEPCSPDDDRDLCNRPDRRRIVLPRSDHGLCEALHATGFRNPVSGCTFRVVSRKHCTGHLCMHLRMSAWICGLQGEHAPRKHDPAFQYQPECTIHSIRMV